MYGEYGLFNIDGLGLSADLSPLEGLSVSGCIKIPYSGGYFLQYYYDLNNSDNNKHYGTAWGLTAKYTLGDTGATVGALYDYWGEYYGGAHVVAIGG